MNHTLALVRYAAVSGKGWRRGAAIVGKTGRIKHEWMLIGGKEIHAPNGRYQIRKYQGKQPLYIELGNDPGDAMSRFRSEEAKNKARAEAKLAGLELAASDDTCSKPTLKNLRNAFIDKHRNLPHRSDDSLAVYSRVTQTFLERSRRLYPEQVSEDDLVGWHGWMRRDMRYSPRTCSNYYKSLRTFLTYCEINLKRLVTEGTDRLLKSYLKKLPTTYSPETVAALVGASTDENRALLWDFAYKTGLRDNELRQVTRYDFPGLETEEPFVAVRERDEYGRIKDLEERLVELHPSLVPPIKRWLKRNPDKVLLFGTGNDLCNTKMLIALKVTARRANLNCGRCKGCKGVNNECGEFTLHKFRRTFTTRLLRAAKGDLRSVMARTGHADIATVMRYLEPAESMRQAVMDAF